MIFKNFYIAKVNLIAGNDKKIGKVVKMQITKMSKTRFFDKLDYEKVMSF